MRNTRNIAKKIQNLNKTESEVCLPCVNDTEEVKLLKYEPKMVEEKLENYNKLERTFADAVSNVFKQNTLPKKPETSTLVPLKKQVNFKKQKMEDVLKRQQREFELIQKFTDENSKMPENSGNKNDPKPPRQKKLIEALHQQIDELNATNAKNAIIFAPYSPKPDNAPETSKMVKSTGGALASGGVESGSRPPDGRT